MIPSGAALGRRRPGSVLGTGALQKLERHYQARPPVGGIQVAQHPVQLLEPVVDRLPADAESPRCFGDVGP